jgi:hypothetical protein
VDNVEIDNVTVHDIDDRQSIKFRSGSVEPTAGETVCDSGNTCMTLVSYRKTGGTWAGGDASGWMVFRDCDYYHYAPQKDEILSGSVSGADFATADSDLYNWGTGIECNGDDGNIEYVSITDSEIYNIADPTNQNGDATEGVGIRFGQYVDSGLAARNYIHDTEGSAISIFQSDDMTIRYNVIENAGSPHPDRDVKKSAIRVLSAPADSQVDVHNNTVVGGVIGFYGTTTNDSAIVNVYNNIFDAGNTLSPEHVMSTSMSGMIVDNFNLHYGFPGYENTIPGPSTIEADPAFRSISECPYFPDFASPALDAAFMDASSPGPNAEDYMGNVLTDNGGVLKSVYGASLDIGACEYSIYGNDTVYECFADVPSVCGSPWDAYANATAVDDSGGMYTDWISVAAGSRILVQMYGEATLNATLTADVDDFPGGEQDTEQSWMFTGQDIFHWTGEAPTNMRMRLRIDGIDMDSGDTAKLLLGTKPVVVE